MRWSKVKKKIEDNFADSLNNQIKVFFTKYTSHHDAGDLANRAWISVNAQEVVNFSTLEAFKITGCIYNSTTPTYLWKIDKNNLVKEVGKLIANGEFSGLDFTICCFEFLNMNIDDALNHKSAIINSLAILDKRVGKRILKKIESSKLHPLAAFFYELRLKAENI